MPPKKAIKKPLAKVAEENTTVTKGTKSNQSTLKAGTPCDHSEKHQILGGERVVGMNLGITKNMDNYESLRVDCWLTDTVNEDETVEQAYERVLGTLDKVLMNTISSYTE